MSESHILRMLEQGIITVDEATGLLEAITTSSMPASPQKVVGDRTSPPPGTECTPVETDQVIPGPLPPDVARWKHTQQIPLALSLIVLILSAWGLYRIYVRADARFTLGWVAVLIVFLMAVAGTAISFWMLTAPWIHVRVHERSGKRIAISLPVPLTLAHWGIRIARRFVDDETGTYLDTSSEFLRAMHRERGQAEPIVVNVDENGQRVQVYIG
jgi:hypothetical protein